MQGLDPELVRNLYVIVGVLVAVWVIERVLEKILPLISPKKNGANGKGNPGLVELMAQVRELIDKVDDLYDWHNHRDRDGVFLWYTRQSMYEVLDKLVAILQEIRQDQRETRNAVDSIAKRG